VAPTHPFPKLLQVVLDTTDVRGLAEFYRQLLGYTYRSGDEPPPAGQADEAGQDWLVLQDASGTRQMAFQQVDGLARPTWPDATVPQQLHLDLLIETREAFDYHCARASELGATLLLDRSDDPREPLRVFADLAGHPFCLFTWQT
jgi:hypothetical protein